MTLSNETISLKLRNFGHLDWRAADAQIPAPETSLAPFSRDYFYQAFRLAELEQTLDGYFQAALQHPTVMYLFFQRYTHFNAYTSAVISRLASSIAMSRYLFMDPQEPVIEEADRGFNIAMKVMVAAADEGSNDGAPHRTMAQLLLKTMGDYAELSVTSRNRLAVVPAWLQDICDRVMVGYQGVPGDIAALVRSIGFHAASELMGDIEYALVDKVIRHDHKGTGFDQYLSTVGAVERCGHRYHPWCYVLVHSRYQGSGVEASHFECVVDALNLVVEYRPESLAQIEQWALEGFHAFVTLEQQLFHQMHQECQLRLAQPQWLACPAAIN